MRYCHPQLPGIAVVVGVGEEEAEEELAEAEEEGMREAHKGLRKDGELNILH